MVTTKISTSTPCTGCCDSAECCGPYAGTDATCCFSDDSTVTVPKPSLTWDGTITPTCPDINTAYAAMSFDEIPFVSCDASEIRWSRSISVNGACTVEVNVYYNATGWHIDISTFGFLGSVYDATLSDEDCCGGTIDSWDFALFPGTASGGTGDFDVNDNTCCEDDDNACVNTGEVQTNCTGRCCGPIGTDCEFCEPEGTSIEMTLEVTTALVSCGCIDDFAAFYANGFPCPTGNQYDITFIDGTEVGDKILLEQALGFDCRFTGVVANGAFVDQWSWVPDAADLSAPPTTSCVAQDDAVGVNTYLGGGLVDVLYDLVKLDATTWLVAISVEEYSGSSIIPIFCGTVTVTADDCTTTATVTNDYAVGDCSEDAFTGDCYLEAFSYYSASDAAMKGGYDGEIDILCGDRTAE